MPAAIDMTGQIHGRLIALWKVPPHGTKTFWKFWCECGSVKDINAYHVRTGRIQSCGCYLVDVLKSEEHRQDCIRAAALKPVKHGKSRTPVHAVWKAMIQRCTNPKAHDYRWYGALGIKVCDRWRDFQNFYADMGEPNGLTLERIDNNGNYEPGNCKWATWEEQRANKRAH